MRISTSAIFNANVDLLNQQQAKLLHTQQQIATGRRILTPAEDPIGSARALDVTQSDASNTQYATNRNTARHTTSLAENTLKSVTELLQDVKTTAVNAGDGSMSFLDRKILATDLRSRLDELIALANSTDGIGNYLFSGFQGRTLPFSDSAAGVQYLADDGQRMVQVSASRQLAASDSGSDIFMRIKNGNGTFATGQVTTPLTLSTNATIASPVVTAATPGSVIGAGAINFTPNAATVGAIAAGDLTILIGAGPAVNVGTITLDGANNDTNIAAALDAAYVAAGGTVGTFTAAAGVVTKAADAGITFNFGIGGMAASAAAATATQAALVTETGLTAPQLGTQAYVTNAFPVVTAATAGAVVGAGATSFTPNAATVATIAAGAMTIQIGAGAPVNVGAITLDGINNDTNIAAALDAAYVTAGGTVGTFTAAAGVVTKAADGAITFNFGMGGTAVDSATAAANQATLANQAGLTAAQVGTQAYFTSNIVNVASTATLVVGATITGGGFPAGTTVQSIIDGTTFTTSAPAVPSNAVGQTLQVGVGNTGTGIVSQGMVTDPTLLTGHNYQVTFAVTTAKTIDTNATVTGANAVTVASTAGLSVGTPISGSGFPAGTTVASVVNGTTFTTSASTALTTFPATGQLISIPGGVITYGVTDTTTGLAVAAPASTTLNAYVSGQAISFDGLRLDVSGKPVNGDAFTIVPSTSESIFKTISNLITALGTVNASSPGASATQFTNSLNTALNNLDRDLDNVLAVRASQGTRLRELDALQSAGEDLGLQFKQTLTQLQDVDYNRAISDLTLQKTSLEAAQKSFLNVSQLSLFNYM